ncbi:uncharacterized protein LOC122663091 [Telopea speciosissima]|uniref:uncharacterized protein LOC122663091 n=1 Tax=Telopea speciosissima TaxID=54955 RepID=UPI001CC770CD|nr:uncharacterized protein LOC122663091 [Telopea speciosissima]
MGTPKEVYNTLEEKLKRTVFLDNLSPHVTAAVLKSALGQFVNVIEVQFIPNYMGPSNIPRCALVELETVKQAQSIVEEMTNYPFMMSGMPRPVRACVTQKEMFDRPKKSGLDIRCRWADPMDPNFEVATKEKDLIKKHQAEASLLKKVKLCIPMHSRFLTMKNHVFLLQLELEEEEKLMKHQYEVLQANYKKFEMIDSVVADKTLTCLASRYGMRMKDD